MCHPLQDSLLCLLAASLYITVAVFAVFMIMIMIMIIDCANLYIEYNAQIYIKTKCPAM